MKKVLLCVTLSVSLTACINTAGETDYTLKPIETANGELICCEARVYNSKDYKKLKFKFNRNTEGVVEVELIEEGVSSSDPATIQAENNTKLLDAVTSIIPVINK